MTSAFFAVILLSVSSDTLSSEQHEQPVFVCDEDIDRADITGVERELEDRLWDETLSYLRGVRDVLTTPAGCLDGPRAVTQTLNDAQDGVERRCITRYRDVELMIKHLDAVLEYPEAARACFDNQARYEAFQLYSPNAEMVAADPVATWINRPTLEDYYTDRDDEVGEAGRELAAHFEILLANTVSEHTVGSDVTFNGLPTLWRSVGWLPFYAESESGISPRFRGGYTYAEVMGPWGLLRIKSIDGETVGAEIGMTVQLGDTFYPYHYHHPQEWYITLTPNACVHGNEFAVMFWDNPAFNQIRRERGWRVEVPADDADMRFIEQGVEQDWLTYFERNAIHAFNVAGSCNGEPSGLVSIWARTTARDNDQTTRMCVVADSEGNLPIGPGVGFICELDDWEY